MQLSFYINYNTEIGYDGCQLGISYDGVTWSTVTAGTSNTQNWYTSSASIGPTWGGNSNGWLLASYDFGSSLDNMPSVTFQFVFWSDATIVAQGCAIDNFLIQGTPS